MAETDPIGWMASHPLLAWGWEVWSVEVVLLTGQIFVAFGLFAVGVFVGVRVGAES